MRRAGRRDKNESELIDALCRMGGHFERLNDASFDGIACVDGRWFPVEIKSRVWKYTQRQVEFRDIAMRMNAPFWTWRTVDDVVQDVALARQWYR